MRGARHAPVIVSAVALALAGCAHNWQSTEAATPMTFALPASRVGRGVSNLKRLVVLPALYNAGWTGSFAKVACVTSADAIRGAFAGAAANFLARSKDYQVVVAEERVKEDGTAGAEREYLGEYSRRFYEVRGGSPSAETAALARRIGVAFNVDGIVLVRGDYTSEDPITVPLMLFGIAKPGLTVEAWIFEAGSGKTVWMGSSWGPGCYSNVEPVFGDLENAIPDVMMR